jgi:hypothetical protein
MAVWKVSNSAPKSLAEREIWTHSDKGEIVRETLFTNGAYLVVTEDDNPPEFEREAVPGGDGAEDSVDMNFCGYETQLIGLEGGVRLVITWPDDMGNDERQALIDAWEEDSYDAWESEGWDLDDTEVWFWDDLNIELVESGNGENQKQASVVDEGWFLSSSPPSTPGLYAIETVEKVVWPNFPTTQANWNGKKWLDEDGETVAVARWKEMAN